MRLPALAAALALTAAVLPDLARAAEKIDGVWKGNYECAQGKTALTLTLDGDADGDIDGTFAFDFQGVSGSYRLRGVITPDGELKLNPTTWISQPDGYGMVGLAGRAYDRSREGQPDALFGDVTDPSCGKFAAAKQ
ncbi:MAG: hypothetical protein Q7T61_20965 [Caulobacter sp.]|nr:hypothetical protein [Caulobacter sp.]